MTGDLPWIVKALLNLPHPLELVWLGWVCFVPWHWKYLQRQSKASSQLSTTGELMNFTEIRAMGCLGGFVLLTFILAYCASLTWRMAGLI